MEKIILIDKPKNWTSNDVVQKIKCACKFKKIGHAGTLDPNATGLLILAYDESTKKLNNLFLDQKQYLCSIKFGIETDTGDITGKIIYTDLKNIDLGNEIVMSILQNFLKNYKFQKPHKYSAIKINGKKAYEYARDNIEVDIKEKPINFINYEIISIDNNNKTIELLIDVSKGFYVRSFCMDFAKQLNTVATLINLRRIKSGCYNVKDALTIVKFIEQYKNDQNN